jgi:hypothetical protein
MIVIEGPDNSGKSTLARHIVRDVVIPIQESEGPPKWSGEIVERIHRYRSFPPVIFVRHPCVSNPIYDMTRTAMEQDPIPISVIADFYTQENLFIYCDPGERTLEGHEIKSAVDTHLHLNRITNNRKSINEMYRKWAIAYAHVIYRIGDDMDFVKKIVHDWWRNIYDHRRIG